MPWKEKWEEERRRKGARNPGNWCAHKGWGTEEKERNKERNPTRLPWTIIWLHECLTIKCKLAVPSSAEILIHNLNAEQVTFHPFFKYLKSKIEVTWTDLEFGWSRPSFSWCHNSYRLLVLCPVMGFSVPWRQSLPIAFVSSLRVSYFELFDTFCIFESDQPYVWSLTRLCVLQRYSTWSTACFEILPNNNNYHVVEAQ